ncbi:hypothetical protein Glove_624g25 [Diversispora epigaea]|uniref:MI domain-containing protein n=1 Tax=Diversispora epigaea TaxID=1348612 RepID=A0A397G9T0_9GLOM|nr:hypothetical protein Glove_624g25 [Diversispora epigaea]
MMGSFILENVEAGFIFELMFAINEFELEELTNKLETRLIDTKASWLKELFSLVYRTIFSKNNFTKLNNFATILLSNDEVLDSIRPYKKILDEKLWKDIDQHLLSPKRPV